MLAGIKEYYNKKKDKVSLQRKEYRDKNKDKLERNSSSEQYVRVDALP
jgi:hypothetical protein